MISSDHGRGVPLPQVDMLRPGLLGSYDEFGKKYCVPEGPSPAAAAAGGRGGGRGYFPGQQYYGCNAARVDELHRLLLANVVVRRTKAQVGLSLPTKTRMKVSRREEVKVQLCVTCTMVLLSTAVGYQQ